MTKFALFFLLLPLCAQTPEPRSADPSAPNSYALGPDDQVLIRVLDAEEIGGPTPIRIDSRGNISLPMVGRIQVAGLTPEQLEDELETRLKKYLVDPKVTVSLVELRSQPISVLGAVNQPGVHQLAGKKTLFEVLSLAGGLRQDAGYSVKITRKLDWGRIPLPSAQDDPTGQFSVASVNVKSIMDATAPQDNILIKPEDVVSVPKADIVYAVGGVRKPGGFVLGDSRTISALQVVSLAEGLERFADLQHAKIMRPVPNSTARNEIPVDLKSIMNGKGSDVQLQANDVLFVPLSGRKAATARALETIAGISSSAGSALVIYR